MLCEKEGDEGSELGGELIFCSVLFLAEFKNTHVGEMHFGGGFGCSYGWMDWRFSFIRAVVVSDIFFSPLTRSSLLNLSISQRWQQVINITQSTKCYFVTLIEQSSFQI